MTAEEVAGAEDAAVKNTGADEIHWTISGPTSVTFDWRGEASTVRWRAKEGAERSVAGRTPRPVPFSSPGPFWEATVHGLKP
ncbi:MAG TPA: hypothetical protein VNO55_19115, partial [Polyangia bacterium]|nr:hypothetical protein [Polyangia bacterium]